MFDVIWIMFDVILPHPASCIGAYEDVWCLMLYGWCYSIPSNFLHLCVSTFTSSSQSVYILWYCSSVRYSLRCNRSIQYNDSRASFRAMYDFDLKSALLMALDASALFAPILVPDLNSWLAKAATDWRCTGTRDGWCLMADGWDLFTFLLAAWASR